MGKTIGVIGAGTMGNGIAQTAAAAGYQVILQDVQDSFLQRGLDTIQRNLNRSVEKGKLSTEEASRTLGRIKGTVHMEELSTADIVIEAIIENMDSKKSLIKKLDEVCGPNTIIASNTSGLSITELWKLYRPSLSSHWHALFQSSTRDEAGRDCPRAGNIQ